MRTVWEVVEDHGLEPNRSGYIHCPWHEDHQPSCKINEEEGFVYCFSCQATADAAGLEAQLSGRDVADVLRSWDDGSPRPTVSKASKRQMRNDIFLDWVTFSQQVSNAVRDTILNWRLPDEDRYDFWDMAERQVDHLYVDTLNEARDKEVSPFELKKNIERRKETLRLWASRWMA